MGQLDTVSSSVGESVRSIDIAAYSSYLEGLAFEWKATNIEENLMGFQFQLPDGTFAYPTAIKIKGAMFFSNLLPEKLMDGSIPADDSQSIPRSHYFFERFNQFYAPNDTGYPEIEAIGAYKKVVPTIPDIIKKNEAQVADFVDPR